jgi:hypothetical protein
VLATQFDHSTECEWFTKWLLVEFHFLKRSTER